MNCAIIITTCNRAERASKTISQFLQMDDWFFNEIIVVDSSHALHREAYPEHDSVFYIKSLHMNQPYQRYLGYLFSSSEVLLYLDDDMDLIDPISLRQEICRLIETDIVGVNFNFENHNDFLASVPRNATAEWNGSISQVVRSLSGSPKIDNNKFWLCGLRGQRSPNAPIEYLSGGAFAAKRSSLYQNFNFVLFSLFEKRLGGGEDVILGYTLAQEGKIWAAEGCTFYHDDQRNSSYTQDSYSFSKRVAFSRLYLSREYARLKCMNMWFANIHYHWYMLWRATGLAFSVVLLPSTKRWANFRGWVAGWLKTSFWHQDQVEAAERFWVAEAKWNLENAKPAPQSF